MSAHEHILQPAADSPSAPPLPPPLHSRRLPLPFLLIIFLATAALFFHLRHYSRPGADSGEMILLIASYDVPVFYFRSPLTFLLHQHAYRLLHTAGWNAADTIALCSSIAGGFYVVTLFLFSRHLLFLLFNLSAGVMFIFLGHVENYAWVNMLVAVYCYFARDYLQGKRSLFPATCALVAACLFHMLALFYFPTWLYLALTIKREGMRFRVHLTTTQSDMQRILFLFIGATLFMALGALAAPVIHGLDVHRTRLVPLFHNPNPTRYFFTMFSLAHAQMLLHFITMASPLGIPALIALSWRIKGKWHTFLLVAFVCGLAFAVLWHPDMGKNDWDLFSTWAIPLNLLVGLLLANLFPQKLFTILSFVEIPLHQKQTGRDTPDTRVPAR